MKLKIFSIWLLVLLFAVPGWAADQVDFPNIYVDADAGDGGVGSQADPYNELSDVNWSTGGDNSVYDHYDSVETESVTIYLQSGDVWYERMMISSILSGVLINTIYPLVITRYGTGDNPVIDGSDNITTSGWTDQGSNIWRYNIGSDDPEVVWFDGSTGTRDATPAAFGEWTYSDPNLDVYATDDPDNEVYYSSIEAKIRSECIYVIDTGNVTVDSVDVRRATSSCIRFWSWTDHEAHIENITIKNLDASYCSTGIHPRNSTPGYEVQNVLIDNCTAHHNGSGIYIVRTNDSIIQNCVSYSNGRTWNQASEEYGIAGSGSDNLIRNNTIYNNEGNGIHLYGQISEGKNSPTNRNKIYGNSVYSNGLDADYTPGAEIRIVGHADDRTAGELDQNEVYQNLVKSNLGGIYIDGTNYKIYSNLFVSLSGTDTGAMLKGNQFDTESFLVNNVFHGYQKGIFLGRSPSEAAGAAYGGSYASLVIKNNIIDDATTGYEGRLEATFDYNLLDNTTDYIYNVYEYQGTTDTNAEMDFWINPESGNSFFRTPYADMSVYAGASPAIQMTITDGSSETIVGYIGEADSAKSLDSELITTQNNRDFSSGTVGNWIVVDDCTDSSVVYDDTSIGGNTSHGKIIVDETTDACALVYAQLSTSQLGTIDTRGTYAFSVDVYVPAANTINNVKIAWASIDSDRPSGGQTFTLSDDTWTTITLDAYLHDDVTGYLRLGFSSDSEVVDGDVVYFDNITVKKVLTSGTDGVRIYTTSGLTTQGWVDSGTNFDFTADEYVITFDSALSDNDVSGNPLFINSDNLDFRLRWNSPAKGVGTDLGDTYDRDWYKRSRDAFGWSIGAFAFKRRHYVN